MELHLSNCSIRPLRLGDAGAIARHLANRNVSRYMSGVPHPYSLGDAEEWLAAALSQTPETHFAIVVDEEVAGCVGLKPSPSRFDVFKHSAEIGYWLGEPFWNRGIMRDAVAAVTEWAFSARRLVRIHAIVYAQNEASSRVLVNSGYAVEGRLRAHYFCNGEFIDALLYANVRLPS